MDFLLKMLWFVVTGYSHPGKRIQSVTQVVKQFTPTRQTMPPATVLFLRKDSLKAAVFNTRGRNGREDRVRDHVHSEDFGR